MAKKFEIFFVEKLLKYIIQKPQHFGSTQKILKHTFLVVYAKVTSFRTTSRIFFRVPIQKFWKNYLADFDNFFCDDSKMSSEEAFYWSLLEINFLLHFFQFKVKHRRDQHRYLTGYHIRSVQRFILIWVQLPFHGLCEDQSTLTVCRRKKSSTFGRCRKHMQGGLRTKFKLQVACR